MRLKPQFLQTERSKFDVYNNTYNVYVDDKAIAADVAIDKNTDKNIEEFSSIEYYVTAGAAGATVNSVPVDTGAYTKIPTFAKVDDGFVTGYEDYTVSTNGTTVTAAVAKADLNGSLILAECDADKNLVKVVISKANSKKISIEKSAKENSVKFMLWSDFGTMKPIITAVDAE